MKPATRTASLVFLIGLAVCIGWWLSSPRRTVTSTSATPKPVPTTPKASTPNPPTADVAPIVVQPFARTPMLGVTDPRWKEYHAKRKVDPSFEWRTPIQFYGKVIDEQNLPVVGAEVEFSWSGTSEKYGGDGVGHRTMTSDANGLFVINGIEGKGMSVRVRKDGYHSRRTWNGGSFEYSGFWAKEFIEPDRNEPVVFQLVKRPVAEPTLRVRQRSLPKPPVWETRIDFLAQPAESTAGGDIVLKLTRPSNPGYQNPFDWQLKIEGVSGAEISISEDEFMLRAPDEGYQKAVAKEYKQVRGNSIETVKFYVRNKARKLYAAVSVEVTPYYPNHATKEDTACFIVTATVNPNDSPNVEYDPEKDIREMAKK